ncbi:MAG: MFS transporter [Candidatus Eremiobacteraeota bacterium]|nr:MFS transporter [Candidatus Eremiobacteraeota bacterium]
MITRSVRQQSLLNAYWIPINFQNAALITIAVPAALLRISGANHTAVLAVLISVVAAVAMLVPPLAGAISDYFRRRGGLRRPFIVLGAAVNVLGLVWMSRTAGIDTFAAALIVAVLGQSISLAAYQPLIPEVVDRAEWGLASGYQGIAALIGSVLGLAFASLLPPPAVFVWTAVFVIAGAALVAATPEGRLIDSEDHARIGNWFNFSVAVVSRIFVNFGLTLLMTFVLYYFNDVLHDQNAQASTGFFGGLALVGAVVTSFWMGHLSDRVPRKTIVAIAGVPMALAILIFALAPNTHWIVVVALLFGLGYGAIVSTGWALAIDSVPQLRDVARDLGLWGLATGLPGIAAPAFGGWLLLHYASPLAGYKTLFFISAGCFVLGSLTVLLIGFGRRSRPQ